MSKARGLADLGNVYDDGALSNRNMVVNGSMIVAQRGISSTTQGFATVDRFKASSDGTMVAAVVTQSQDATGPQDFSNSYKISVGTSEAVAAADYYYVSQSIEAQNLQQLSFGTSDAKSITLSFWVKSSVTGTYTVSVFGHDAQRVFPKTYTVSSANTWEKKVIVVDADTTGTIANDNGRGIDLYWGLSAGSNWTTGTDGAWAAYASTNFLANHTADVIGTTSATWQITGVQLEVGDTATPFEHRSYSDELQRCQRYTYIISGAGYTPATSSAYARYVMFGSGPTTAKWITPFPTTMRAVPSLTTSNFTSSTVQIFSYTDEAPKTLSSVSLDEGSINHQQVTFTISGSGLADTITWRWNNSPAAYIGFDAEL